jgi:plastocyanin
MTATRRPVPAAMPTLHPRRRRRPQLGFVAAAFGIGMLAAACTGSASGAGPSFTYAPSVPSASTTPGMDMGSSASPPTSSAPAPAAPSAAGPASAPPTTPSTSAATGAVLRISAQNIAFDTNQLEAPAGQAFVLDFNNNDPGVPHNVEIKDANGMSMFKGQIITGPATISYQVPALAAGSYMFVCDVHPNMTGTLTAK